VIVILSTHIVEDVSQLCPNMAILINGEVRLQGKPARLIQEIDGTIWSKLLPRNQTDQYKSKFNVISERLVLGQTQILVQSEFQPEIGFELVSANLEDVYFATLKKFEQGAQYAR